jgi:uncharacterized DUF497 family protein
MRLAAADVTRVWRSSLRGISDDFEWDAGNRDKHTKHGVTPADVEATVRGDVYFAGRIVAPPQGESRWLLLGRDGLGRHLALIFTRRGVRLRPICCRPMRRSERVLHDQAHQT